MHNSFRIPVHTYRLMLDDYMYKNPVKIDPNLKRDLKHGWLIPYLFGIDTQVWGRWAYWLQMAETKTLPTEPIPQIDFDLGEGIYTVEGNNSKARKHLDECLDIINQHPWQGFTSQSTLTYFLEWLLYGFGASMQPTLPPEPSKGASMRLYQKFNLTYLLAYPWDYFGGLFVDCGVGGGRNAFYPTPMTVCRLMYEMTMPAGQDLRLQTFMEPCIGTGRMALFASNHCLVIYGADIEAMCIKASIVNMYLYAPWAARPLTFLDDLAEFERESPLYKAFTSVDRFFQDERSQALVNPLYCNSIQIDAHIKNLETRLEKFNWLSVV